MNEQHQPELNKIERVSRVLEVIFGLALVLSIVIPVVGIGFMASSPTSNGESFFVREQPMQEMTFSDDDIRDGKFTLADKVGVSAIAVAFGACFAFCFWFAVQLMRRFKNHRVFGSESVRLAKGMAYSYLAGVLLFAGGTLAAAIMIGDLRLNGNLTQSFISAGLAWLFVWVIQIGTTLYTENEMTI